MREGGSADGAEAPARRPRWRHAGIIVGAAAVAVAVPVAVRWSRSDADAPTTGEVLAGALSRSMDTVVFGPDAEVEMPTCPLGEPAALLAAVDSVTPIDPRLVDGSVEVKAFPDSVTFPGGVFCNLFVPGLAAGGSDDEPTGVAPPWGVSVSLTLTPDVPYDEFLRSLITDVSVVIDPAVGWDGAHVTTYCTSVDDGDGQTGCGADWVDDLHGQVVLSLYLAGETDSARTRRALAAVLPVVLAAADAG